MAGREGPDRSGEGWRSGKDPCPSFKPVQQPGGKPARAVSEGEVSARPEAEPPRGGAAAEEGAHLWVTAACEAVTESALE